MFKRLKRIEALMERFLANEDECLKIVRRRELEYKLDKAFAQGEASKPWKCPHPECTVELPHAHAILMTPSSDGVKQ
jgi:hypothetical protein